MVVLTVAMDVIGVASAASSADDFIRIAHDAPNLAIAMLCGNPSLAGVRSTWGENALEAASHLGHKRLIAALVDSGSRLDVFSACALGMKRVIRRLLAGVPLDALGVHGLPILHFGIVGGDLQTVEELVAAGVPVNPPCASLPPLHSAVASGSPPMVRALIAAGADTDSVDAFGATAADWAIELDGRGSRLLEVLRRRSP